MVLRAYQFYAVEAILDKALNTNNNGYIWHTTGSGKTLTSFKTALLATQLPYVDKVLFVVDRKDLDYQTMKEYQKFSPDGVNGSNSTEGLKKNIENEPQSDYVYIYPNNRDWAQDFAGYVQWLKQQNVSDLAVFFRTNNEVYHGYSLIKALNLPGIRIRIQGASACELFRMREIYAVLKLLDDNGNKRIKFNDNQSELALKEKITSWIQQFPNWDSFYLDFAYVLSLDYLDFAAGDEESHTYGEMADSIRETLKEDNPQLYKLYDDKRYADRRILVDQQMNVVLTTMHKVKGLEFDAVIITPSVASLPFNPTEDIDVSLPLSESDIEQIEEEQRLLYVAYTRAKKYLFVYKGDREYAVENMQRFKSNEDQWGIRERKVGLDNYNIGYNAGFNYKNFKEQTNNAMGIVKNAPVCILGTAESLVDLHSVAAPIQAGRTPNATRSERESIWIPNLHSSSLLSFFILATFPSKASHNPHIKRKKVPIYGCPSPASEITIPAPADSNDTYVNITV